MNWNLLHKYLSGECSLEEMQKVEGWLRADKKNQRFMDSLDKVWKVESDDEIEVDAKSAWNSFQHKITDKQEQVREKRNIYPLNSKHSKTHTYKRDGRTVGFAFLAAAVVLIAVLLYRFMPQMAPNPPEIQAAAEQPQMQEIITEQGQRTTFQLFDGTRVHLNADSKIEIPLAYGDSIRKVYLEGEAYFEVAHNRDKPFVVYSGDAYVEVLGTKFGVRAYEEDEQVQIAVEEGKVSLGSSLSLDEEGKHITRNQVGLLAKSGEAKVFDTEEIQQYLGWKDGRLNFNGVAFSEVKPQLERWYNIDIVLADPAVRSQALTASFMDEPMTEVMNIISLSLDVNYEREGRIITFYKN
ncbi:MAG: FecR domain-containing protein [Balneolales bacterium]